MPPERVVFPAPESPCWIKVHAGEACTEQDIRNFCTDHIAHYKVPRYIRFVDEFPMTVTGKIQKFVMRKRMAEELSWQEHSKAS